MSNRDIERKIFLIKLLKIKHSGLRHEVCTMNLQVLLCSFFPEKWRAQPAFLSFTPPSLRRELQGCYFALLSKRGPFQLPTKVEAQDCMKQDQLPQRGSSSLPEKQPVPGRVTHERPEDISSGPLCPPSSCVSLDNLVNFSEPCFFNL